MVLIGIGSGVTSSCTPTSSFLSFKTTQLSSFPHHNLDTMHTESASECAEAREVPFAQAKRAGASLAECFSDDEVARYYLQVSDCGRPLTATEAKLNLCIYECLTAAHCYSSLAISAGPHHDSVSLWLPPGSSDWSWKTYWKSNLWLLWLRLGRKGRRRFFGSWSTLEVGVLRVFPSVSEISEKLRLRFLLNMLLEKAILTPRSSAGRHD